MSSSMQSLASWSVPLRTLSRTCTVRKFSWRPVSYNTHETALARPDTKSRGHEEGRRGWWSPWTQSLMAGSVLAVAGVGLSQWDRPSPLLRGSCKSAPEEYKAGQEQPDLPNYSKAEISKHKSPEDGGVWVTYKDGVYDVTQFLPQHPGGSDKLLLAAGDAVDPYWQVFAQHATPEVEAMIEEYRIGNILPADRAINTAAKEGPYAHDPTRSPIFKVNTNEPFNAETPPVLLPEHFKTPNDIFFVRNHLPVPQVNKNTYRLQVSVPGHKEVSYSLEDLKSKFPQYTVTATIQCAGNRREELARVKEVRGLSWTGGAIGNASWTGPRLRDVLADAGLAQSADEDGEVQHIHFEGLDQNPLTGVCYGASIPVEKALSARGDCLLVHTMNDDPLPRDHGYPVRVVVPGTVGARNVKWVGRVVASDVEYGGQWQQRDYKGFSPSVDWSNVDFSTAPAIQELPVTSLICAPPPNTSINTEECDTIMVEGMAWSGGGRGIVRVDVSPDGGKTWLVATLKEGTGQKPNRAWSWTTWEVEIPVDRNAAGRSMELCCKAVDSSYNVQPDTVGPIWNLRGCLSNAWHRIHIKLN